MKGDLDCHSSLAVRLRRGEKKILENVVLYAASQKASAVERCEQAAASRLQQDNEGDESTSGSRPLHVSCTSTDAGEQEFVRVDGGTPVYGTDAERAASDAEFFESVRRGDFHRHAVPCQSGGDLQPEDGEQNPAVAYESEISDDLTRLDVRTSGSHTADGEGESDETYGDSNAAGVEVNSS